MNVRSAIARLEKRRDHPGQCPECRGLGRYAVCIDEEAAAGCRVCGLLGTVKRILLGNESPRGP